MDHHLYQPSGVQPCPDVPYVVKLQDNIDVLKREMRPYENSYELPIIPDEVARDPITGQILLNPVTGLNQLESHFVTYADHGRVQVHR